MWLEICLVSSNQNEPGEKCLAPKAIMGVELNALSRSGMDVSYTSPFVLLMSPDIVPKVVWSLLSYHIPA